MTSVIVLVFIGLAFIFSGCGGGAGVYAKEVNATCAYHRGLANVVNGPNNEAFVKCKDGYGKEIESHE